jgi:hypothetical protein
MADFAKALRTPYKKTSRGSVTRPVSSLINFVNACPLVSRGLAFSFL